MNCNAVEPVTKAGICQREAGHPLAHLTVLYDDEGGQTTVEWYDTSHLRKHLRRLKLIHGEEQGTA